MSSTYVIGDIHGYCSRLQSLLRDAALIDDDDHWSGGDATLCFIGDYFDRGPDGVGVVDLIMRLEKEASAAGGRVYGLLGNHEVFILAARRFQGKYDNFYSDWLTYGGQRDDMARLTDAHVAWLERCPAMLQLENRLLIHSDAMFYVNYGTTVETVNTTIANILQSDSPLEWARLSDAFIERFTFQNRSRIGVKSGGTERARSLLLTFGGKQIIHGHTPIAVMTGKNPHTVNDALVYANKLVVDVDGGLYQGGPGFVYELPTL